MSKKKVKPWVYINGKKYRLVLITKREKTNPCHYCAADEIVQLCTDLCYPGRVHDYPGGLWKEVKKV